VSPIQTRHYYQN